MRFRPCTAKLPGEDAPPLTQPIARCIWQAQERIDTASLVPVDGDPARRVSDIRNIDMVVKDGKVYEVDALYRSIGVLPR